MPSPLFRIAQKSSCKFSQLLNYIAEILLHVVGKQRDVEAEVPMLVLTDKERILVKGARVPIVSTRDLDCQI